MKKIFLLFWVMGLTTIALGASQAHPDFSCLKCHTGKSPTKANQLLRESYEDYCASCHKTHKIKHSTKVKTPSLVGAQFPLDKGRIGCISCHEEEACRSKESLGSAHLRGGPYKDVDSFCAACHQNEKMESGGRQIHFRGKEILSEDCFSCHFKVKKVEELSAQEPRLKLPKAKICMNCHKIDVHPLVKNHVGRKPDFLGKKVAEEKLRAMNITLDQDGTMMCLSCHEPHGKPHAEEQQPQENGETTSADGEISSAGVLPKALLRAEGHVNRVCQTCHSF